MALYQPIYLNPNGKTINPSVSNTFTCKIQGTICVAYDLTIRKNSDNTIVHNSTKTTLPTPLYNNQTLEVTVNSDLLTAGTEYKWRIKLYWDTTNFIESGEIFFKAYSPPLLTLTLAPTINANNYTFAPTYSQTQNIGVKFFIAYLFDENGIQLNTSGKIYSANIQYNFDGFISGNSYKVQFIVEDQNGMQSNTGVQSFNVSYSEPSVNIKPSAILLSDKNAIQIKWANALQIYGNSTGSFTYSSNLFYTGSDEININSNSTIYYNSNIPEQFTVLHKTKLPIGFVGKIIELLDNETSEAYTLGYDGIHFYYTIDGYIHIIPHILPTSVILFAIRPTDVYIKFY